MNTTKTFTATALTLSLLTSPFILADEEQNVDPSDVARAVTSFTVGLSNTGSDGHHGNANQ
ncbi:hypothetical protein BCU13_005950 [Vibrio lentus]|uniref:hypothetical protein n=1 Tax=Vibrio lentus TaxID=136468 RepID=UPI000C850F03|nr:hypothetical protein [Vibrio lentus]